MFISLDYSDCMPYQLAERHRTDGGCGMYQDDWCE